MLEMFPFGRWNGDAGEYVPVSGKLATLAWIEESSFEKMPHSRPSLVDKSLVINGVYASQSQ
jgi:hypothetical protein